MPATSSRWPASRIRAPARRCPIRQKAVLLEKMDFPNPVIEMKDRAQDQGRPGEDGDRVCTRWRHEDPSFRVSVDQESARPSSRAWANCISTSRSTFMQASAAQVSRSTSARRRLLIARRSLADDRHRLHAQEADRRHRPVRPRQAQARAQRTRQGQRVRERDRRRHGAEGIHSRRREGHQVGLGSGILIGFPMVDMKVTLYDGAYHEVDSSAIAFEIAARHGDEGRL